MRTRRTPSRPVSMASVPAIPTALAVADATVLAKDKVRDRAKVGKAVSNAPPAIAAVARRAVLSANPTRFAPALMHWASAVAATAVVDAVAMAAEAVVAVKAVVAGSIRCAPATAASSKRLCAAHQRRTRPVSMCTNCSAG